MEIENIILGFLFSTVVSTLILWLLIDKLGWSYLKKHEINKKEPGILTMPMGIVERILYTTVFLIGSPNIVGFWIALKVASQWGRWSKENERGTYNLFLIGTALSLLLSYIGASIAANQFLTFNA